MSIRVRNHGWYFLAGLNVNVHKSIIQRNNSWLASFVAFYFSEKEKLSGMADLQ